VAGWTKKVGAINLIVGELEPSKAFYRDAFGLDVMHEDDESVMFKLGDTFLFLQLGEEKNEPSADVLRFARMGVGQYVIFVSDANAVHAELEQAGVPTIDGPTDREWGMRTLTLADPAGYTWEITQPLDGG
jgi:catechol 2,3-dioxygenase-like lactoylglutathione lyase family enzyme